MFFIDPTLTSTSSLLAACGLRLTLIQSEKTRSEGPAKRGEISITAKDVMKSICLFFFVRMPYFMTDALCFL